MSEGTGGSKNKLYIGLGIGCAVLLMLACCLVFAVVIFMDPFDLNLLSRFGSGGNTTTQAMPPDTEVFIGVDFVQITSEDFASFFNLFAGEMPETDPQSFDEFISELDRELENEAGFNFSDDIRPWLGQYGGFAMTNVEFDEFGEPESFDFILAIEAADTAAADAFLEKFDANYTQQTGVSFVDREYEGVSIRTANTDDIGDQVAHARAGRIVLLAQKTRAIEAAIDAQKGVSLGDDEGYKDLALQLDRGNFMSAYMSTTFLNELLANMDTADFELTSIPAAGWTQAMFSALITEAGLQLDYVYSIDENTLSETQQQIIAAGGEASKMPDLLPESTLLYYAGHRLDLTWQLIKEQLDEVSAGDFEESLGLLEDQFGINLDQDLFPYLDGEWGIVVLKSNEGMLAADDVPLGLALLAETSNSDVLKTTVITFNNGLSQTGFVDVQSETVAGSDVFSAGTFGQDIAAYGVVDNTMAIATSPGMLNGIFTAETSLAGSPLFQRVSDVFSSDMNIVMFVDTHDFFNAIVEGMSDFEREQFAEEAAPLLQPVRALSIATSVPNGGLSHGTILILVDR